MGGTSVRGTCFVGAGLKPAQYGFVWMQQPFENRDISIYTVHNLSPSHFPLEFPCNNMSRMAAGLQRNVVELQVA